MKKFTLYETRVDDEYVFAVCLTSKFRPCARDSWFGGSRYRIGEFDTVEELSEVLYYSYPDYYTDEADAYEEDGKRLYQDCLYLEEPKIDNFIEDLLMEQKEQM